MRSRRDRADSTVACRRATALRDRTRSSIVSCLLLIVVGATGCPDFSRSKFHLTYDFPILNESLLAPAISRYGQSDGVADCGLGDTEVDYGLLFRTQTFSPSFQQSLKFQPFAACTPATGVRYFVEKQPETVYQVGDDLGGFALASTFEIRLAGRFAMTAGLFTDNTDGVVVSERTGPNSYTHTKVVGTGSTIGTATYDFITGVDFKWTGSQLGLALSYVDTLGGSRLAWCPNLACDNVFGPGSVAGVADYSSPRIGGAEPNVFLAFQTSSSQFGPATRLNFTDLMLPYGAQVIAELGGGVPGLPGETFAGFGGFASHQAGLTKGAFTASSSPSNLSVAVKYDVTDSLSLSLAYKKDDELPDTTRLGAAYFDPAFDGDDLSLRVQTNFSNSQYVSEIPDMGVIARVGTLRATTEAQQEGALSSLQVSNESIVDRISAFQGDFFVGMGAYPVIGIQNLESVDVVRGKPVTLTGSDGIAGVVDFVTRSELGPDVGFDVEVKGTSFTNFGGATFGSDGELYLGALLDGTLYRYDRTTDDVDPIGDTGISEGFAGLARDGMGGFYAVSHSNLYWFDGVNFPATPLGAVQDDLAIPVTDLGGLHYSVPSLGPPVLFAARRSGDIGALDPATLTFTAQYRIPSLPSPLTAITSDDVERAFGGLEDGRVVEFLECPLSGGGGNAESPAATPVDYAFTVLGRRSGSAVNALAVPEPAVGALAAAAFGTLAALGRRRRAAVGDSR